MKRLNSLIVFLLILFLIPFTSASLTSGESLIVFSSVFSLLAIVIFFLVLSIIIQSKEMKVFFIGCCFLSLLASVGVGVSVLQQYFTNLSAISTLYGKFYIGLVTFIGVGAIVLILWLVVKAFYSFYAYKDFGDDFD